MGIVSPREPYLAALSTARRLINGCGSETLSRLSGFLLFSYEISLRTPWVGGVPRSSERPAASRDHWAVGRPFVVN